MDFNILIFVWYGYSLNLINFMRNFVLVAALLGACGPAQEELSCDENPLCTETQFDTNPLVIREHNNVHDACGDVLGWGCYIDFEKKCVKIFLDVRKWFVQKCLLKVFKITLFSIRIYFV